MGLRKILWFLLLQVLYFQSDASVVSRQRRQATNNFPGPPSEPKAYQPPILLSGPSVPVASSAGVQSSYQPPISLIRSNEYQPALVPPPSHFQGSSGRSFQSQSVSGPQSYVLSNQPQHQTHSVQYVPPTHPQQSFSSFQQPALNAFPQPATSYSVQQQPLRTNQGQSYAILSDNSGLPQSTVERTHSTHSKAVGSAHVPVQSINKSPASEIEPEKASIAKEKDKANDEYVIYYYYYYDNDTSSNNNLTLNFDDIPSLESYDNDKLKKEPEKSASARSLTNINSVPSTQEKPEKNDAQPTDTIPSQPRSVGNVYSRPDRPSNSALEETVVQPLKPVSNVFRYGNNEVPRFPVLPNFIVTEVPTTIEPELLSPDTLTSEAPTTQPAQLNPQPDLKNADEEDDDLNNVLDHESDLKPSDEKVVEEEPSTTTTTTEAPTTTEEPTTTTEKSRRRPSFGGGRRRFSPSPSPSFQPSRNRQASSRSTSSTTSTTTTTTASPSKRSFQGNRVRPRRPPVSSNRPRPGARNQVSENESESKAPEATTVSTTSTTRNPRFTTSSRRFQSSRSRSQSTSTSTTTGAPSGPSRSRTTSRPRPNLVTRNRPPRPGFLRPRPGSEPVEPEPTTTPEPEEETSPETAEELPSTDDESNETEEDETSDEETEPPTTTEASRFSALFRPRNRNGNRPRPVIGNRPSRT